jgi:hypothetical protein
MPDRVEGQLQKTSELYMTSSEHRGDLARLRTCRPLSTVLSDTGRPLLKMSIDPSIHDPGGSMKGGTYDEVFVAPHYAGAELEVPLATEPFAVHVLD